MRKVSLERYYFVLYDCALTSKMSKMALKSFFDKTLQLFSALCSQHNRRAASALVTHYQVTAWTDHGIPESPDPMVILVRKVQESSIQDKAHSLYTAGTESLVLLSYMYLSLCKLCDRCLLNLQIATLQSILSKGAFTQSQIATWIIPDLNPWCSDAQHHDHNLFTEVHILWRGFHSFTDRNMDLPGSLLWGHPCLSPHHHVYTSRHPAWSLAHRYIRGKN